MKTNYELFESLKLVCKNIRPDDYEEFIRLHPDSIFNVNEDPDDKYVKYLKKYMVDALSNNTGDELIESLNFVGGFVYARGTNLWN